MLTPSERDAIKREAAEAQRDAADAHIDAVYETAEHCNSWAIEAQQRQMYCAAVARVLVRALLNDE